MSLITWNRSLTLGIESVDKQHQELVRLMNTLHDAMLAGRAKEVIGPILAALVSYTKVHFKYEEKLFRISNYAGIASHMAEHAKFTKQVSEFKNDFDAGNSILSGELLEFLRDWLSKHIQETDRLFVPALKSKGIE